ncbi:MAG: TetR/AcrR family transcriptional regulator [Methanobacterium sp.]
MDAALDEFTMKSYENASLNKIIKNTGISKGTFYYHFQDKKALYIFLQDSAHKTQVEFMKNRMKELSEEFNEKDIFETIKLQTQIGVEFTIAHPKYLKLITNYLKETETPKNKKILEYINNNRKQTIETGMDMMITKAIEHGDFKDEFSKEFIIKIINHLFLNYTEIFPTEENYEMQKYIEDINTFIDFLKYGLGKE